MTRVLIVDDDAFILEGIKRIAGQNFEVDIANSGQEGLHMLTADGHARHVWNRISGNGAICGPHDHAGDHVRICGSGNLVCVD